MRPAGFRRRIRLGPGGEFDLIRAFLDDDEDLPAEVLVGPGDDCAVLAGGRIAVSCDLALEGVHFRREWLAPSEIGYRCAAAALSDIAAVAAVPIALLVSFGLAAEDVTSGVARDLQRGMDEAAKRVGAAVVGGDLTRSPGPLVVDVVALGRAEAPILRDGARVGDEVWVTGALGGAAAAVRMLESGRTPEARLRAFYARPVPRVGEALWLAEHGLLHSLIDLSDGLAADAGHLAAASGLGIVIEGACVPVDQGARGQAGDDFEALEAALSGGDDYELCFTAAPGAVQELAEAFQTRFSVTLSRVGRVVEGHGLFIDQGDGEARPLRLGGYDHFRPDGRG